MKKSKTTASLQCDSLLSNFQTNHQTWIRIEINLSPWSRSHNIHCHFQFLLFLTLSLHRHLIQRKILLKDLLCIGGRYRMMKIKKKKVKLCHGQVFTHCRRCDVSMHILSSKSCCQRFDCHLNTEFSILCVCVVAIWKLAMTMERMSNQCLLWSYQKLTMSKNKQNFIDHSVPICFLLLFIYFFLLTRRQRSVNVIYVCIICIFF